MAKSKNKPDARSKTKVMRPPEDEPLEDVEVKARPDVKKTKIKPVDADESFEDAPRPRTKLDVKSKTKVKPLDNDKSLDDAEPMVKSKTKLDTKSKTKVKPADDEEPEAELDVDAEPEADESKPDDPYSEPSRDEGPTSPPARITWTTIFLILLNWIIAPLFLVVAYYDHAVRTKYTYRTLVNYVGVWGLPLREEEDISLATEARPNLRLTPDQLRKVFKERKSAKGAIITDKEPFLSVDEPVPFMLRPSDMTPELLADIFWDLPGSKKVETLEDEIDEIRKNVPGLIDKAARDILAQAKDDDKKREIIQRTLFPLAWNVWQVKVLDEEMRKATGAALDKLVLDSVQRRIYYDILAPINYFRPGDLKDFGIEKIADRAVPLDTIKGYFTVRMNAAVTDDYKLDVHIGEEWRQDLEGQAMKRDSVEKRSNIGFILFTLSQTQKPTLDGKGVIGRANLIARGVERAQTVCGLYEFTNASVHYVRTLQSLEADLVDAVKTDRQGYLAKVKGKEDLTRTNGRPDDITAEIDRLVKIVEHIDAKEKRLADLKGQRDHAQMLYEIRTKQHRDTMDKLLKTRKTTEQFAKDLRDLQTQLHQSLIDLSDAADQNFQLEATIRDIEERYMREQSKKGGKKRP